MAANNVAGCISRRKPGEAPPDPHIRLAQDRDGCVLVALRPDELDALRRYWDEKTLGALSGRAHRLSDLVGA